MVNGPKGAFTNQPPMIEVQVEFIGRVIGEAKGRVVRVSEEAEEGWRRECEGEARGSLFWEAEVSVSCYFSFLWTSFFPSMLRVGCVAVWFPRFFR